MSRDLNPEESAVVIGSLIIALFFIINVFFRDFLLSYNFQFIAGFIILTAWQEVIYKYKIALSQQSELFPYIK
jgi:hypothetical protein